MRYYPRVVAIVLNYCSYEDTVNCVRALEATKYPNLEIVILDNDSPDDSEIRLRDALSSVPVVQTGANLGYAGGNNFGIRYALAAGAEYVFIVNPDVIVRSDCLDKLVNSARTSITRAAAMPIQFADDGSIDRRLSEHLCGTVGRVPPSTCTFRDWVPLPNLFGAALLIATDALRVAGLFDPLYFCYSEELDLCRRLRFHGYDVGMVPSAIVTHRRSYEIREERSTRAEFREYLRARNALLYRLKNPGRPFWQSGIEVVYLLMRSIITAAGSLDYRRLQRHVRSGLWLLGAISRIYYSRRMEMNASRQRRNGDEGLVPHMRFSYEMDASVPVEGRIA